ncbi:MAG: insulinase family protein [Clostridia bacterium]|nr:insulinase family protein [Clostridia bacterium]
MTPVRIPIGRHGVLLAIPTDRFKSEYLSLSFSVPLGEHTAQMNTLLPAVMRRGTVHYPDQLTLNRHLDDLYSTAISVRNQRAGDAQMMGLAADFLGARFVGGGDGLLPAVIGTMAELLFSPVLESDTLRADYVESEKGHLKDAIRAAINNPRGFALARCRELTCKNEPYALSLSGTEQSADAITAKALTEHHKWLLTQITPTYFYVGNTAPSRVAELLEQAFSVLDCAPSCVSTVARIGSSAPIRAESEMPLCQGKLVIGFRTDVTVSHPLAPAMLMLNEIFGASPASKLFLNVRERESLCYQCGTSLDLYKGVIFASTGIKVENRARAEAAILREFEALTRGEISDTELFAARRSLEYSYRQTADNPAVLANYYTGRAQVGNTESLDDWCARIAAVTRAQLAEAAARIAPEAIYFLKGMLTQEDTEE